MDDLVKLILLNEKQPDAWEKVKHHLTSHNHITNSEARKITGIVQTHTMSRLFKQWLDQSLLSKTEQESSKKHTKYKLPNNPDLELENKPVLFAQDSANKN